MELDERSSRNKTVSHVNRAVALTICCQVLIFSRTGFALPEKEKCKAHDPQKKTWAHEIGLTNVTTDKNNEIRKR